MYVDVWRLSNPDTDEVKYITLYCDPAVYHKYENWHAKRCIIYISDRFKPKKDLFDHVMVTIDGVSHMLDNVLGADRDGNAAFVWHDEKLNCKRTVTIPME